MAQNIQNKIKKLKLRSYLAKDFDSFKAELFRFARTYFPDQIQDFSEASLGGLLLEMAAYVGDSMSYYLDYQFNELFPTTAIETNNILRHLRSAGVPIGTASPASVRVTFSIEVPAVLDTANNVTKPRQDALPVILKNSAMMANGIAFNLTEDLDFTRVDANGKIRAAIEVKTVNVNDGLPTKYKLSLEGDAISGKLSTESFAVPNQHVPFREIVLAETDISTILSVIDTDGSKYYEVNSLSENVVFEKTDVSHDFADEQIYDLGLLPAPRRFVKIVEPQAKLTTLRFGSGNAEAFDDDILPDPSDVALPLYGKSTMSRFVLNPSSLLESQTLGIAPLNTTLTVTYIHGGGLSHNVSANSIKSIDTLNIKFPRGPSGNISDEVRGSVSVTNLKAAGGGMSAPTLDELKEKIPAMRQMQSRIVSSQDLLARVYTLPNKFGRVFRAAVAPNPNNPLATTMFVISKDADNKLAISPDPLKKNLRNYLNEYRLVSDALDVVDARVINFGVEFGVVVGTNSNPTLVIQQITSQLFQLLKVENYQIGRPIILADIVNTVINTTGVISLIEMPKVFIRVGNMEGRKYSAINFDPLANMTKGMIIPPVGAIFELKYGDFDIIGNAS